MHLNAIDHNMLELSKKLGFLKEFSFYLAGGTGFALQTGIRKSFDFDFFTGKDFSPDELSAAIGKHGISVKGKMQSHGTLYCIIEGIKTSFIFYDGALIFPFAEFESINIADWRDIAAEKIRTVADRGLKKDFFDLYAGIQQLGIEPLAEIAWKRFGRDVNYFHLLKGLTYFADAEKDPDPIILGEALSWEKVKEFFVTRFNDFESAFRNISKTFR